MCDIFYLRMASKYQKVFSECLFNQTKSQNVNSDVKIFDQNKPVNFNIRYKIFSLFDNQIEILPKMLTDYFRDDISNYGSMMTTDGALAANEISFIKTGFRCSEYSISNKIFMKLL